MPEFVSALDRQKVEQLMQPALIRVIDNIRKQLDNTDWQGSYEEELIWPEGTTAQQKEDYATLQKGLHGVPTEEYDRVAKLMSALPQPSPLYTLRLQKDGQEDQTVDVWALCYQVCANSSQSEPDLVIAADDSLFNESGIDWRILDNKTLGLVEGIFAALPA
ncbi:MAG: hypothetical protein AAF716_19710 [Cyanobacteria bacterium P01_D01_bin.1]